MSGVGEELVIQNKYLKIIDILNDLDLIAELNKENLSGVELRLNDIDHFIENQDRCGLKLTPKQKAKLIDIIKELRVKRRNLKNDIVMAEVVNKNRNKIGSEQYRAMIKNDVYQKEKSLSKKYHARVMKNADIFDLITDYNAPGPKPKNIFRIMEQENEGELES